MKMHLNYESLPSAAESCHLMHAAELSFVMPPEIGCIQPETKAAVLSWMQRKLMFLPLASLHLWTHRPGRVSLMCFKSHSVLHAGPFRGDGWLETLQLHYYTGALSLGVIYSYLHTYVDFISHSIVY